MWHAPLTRLLAGSLAGRRQLLLLWSMLRIVGAVLIICMLLLYFFQHKMIYFPQPYRTDYKRLLGDSGVEIEYRTDAGRQVAFYVPPRNADTATSTPQSLWLAFGGNASLALFWVDTVELAEDPNAGFLLYDYPGYGLNEGSPNPKNILETSHAALEALAGYLNTTVAVLEKDLSVTGHSLGAAAALQFAVNQPVRKVVLVSPFTSMREMVRHVMMRPVVLLLNHHFDNDKRLEELSREATPPHVVVIHGTDDNVVPVTMSREIAAQFPALVEYHEIPRANHVTILDSLPEHLK